MLFTAIRAMFNHAAAGADQDRLDGQLCRAAQYGDHAKAEKLLEQGANANAPALGDRREPLWLAATAGDEIMCRLLLMHGAKPDAGAPGDTPGTALTQASRGGFLDVVKTLVEFKADVDLQEYSRSPLMEALWKGHTEVAKFLIESGASMEVNDRLGRTPVQEAITLADKPLARFMVDHGADLDFESTSGNSMKDLLRAEGWQDVVDYADARDAAKAKAAADAAAAAEQADADFKDEMAAVHVLKNPVRALKPISFRQRA